MKYIVNVFSLLLIVFLSSCGKSELKNGTWRATVKTESGELVPFNFLLSDSAGKKQVDIINAGEKYRLNDVIITGDSVSIQIPLFDCEIRARIGNNILTGHSIKHLPDKDIIMDFQAEHGISWRFFESPEKTPFNINGRWSAIFTNKENKTNILVGEFKQADNKLTGTFLSPTGDYRYLDGTVSGNKLYLSSFNGSDVYLFTATINNDSTLSDGKYYSGYSAFKNWTAKKDPKASLANAYSLTTLKPGYKTISFNFPGLDGIKVSSLDNKFKNKVLIVQFLGSWCPNCMDETAFLSPFYNKYKNRGVEIAGLAYERTRDFERSKKSLENLKKRFDIHYDLLITGYTNDMAEVMKSMPMLNSYMAFPTTIILDKKGNVTKIHTGFSGPGTGIHYTEFTKEFENTIDSLLAIN